MINLNSSDTGIALLGGFAIYEMLGSMRAKCYLEAGVDRHEVTEETKNKTCEGYLNQKSFGLAFIAYPEGKYLTFSKNNNSVIVYNDRKYFLVIKSEL